MRLMSDIHPRVKRVAAVVVALIVLCGAVAALRLLVPARPPSIFDSPVDDVAAFLAGDAFNDLSVDERLAFLADTFRRFRGMSQTDSAVAAAFFAGLSGPASEQMINNARVLGKDILFQGAEEFQTISDPKARAEFLDQWLVKWARFGQEMTGQTPSGDEATLLDDLSRQAKRDVDRQGPVDALISQQMMDLWLQDVASVVSPREQGALFLFLPAMRDHLLSRGK
jgi:hypothetical protein